MIKKKALKRNKKRYLSFLSLALRLMMGIDMVILVLVILRVKYLRQVLNLITWGLLLTLILFPVISPLPSLGIILANLMSYVLIAWMLLMNIMMLILLFLLPVLIIVIVVAIPIKLIKTNFSKFYNNKTRLPKWIHSFLNDEEKAAILIAYRIEWYGEKRPNKLTHLKVWIKTLHYLFYEVWFKERLDRIKSFQVRMPRW